MAACVAQLSQNREIRLITLTLRINDAPLGDQITRIIKCFSRLRRRKFWRLSQKGGVAFVEVKRRPDSHTWHPHIHMLVEGVYVSKQVLSSAWHEITGDSMVVDIKWVRDPDRAAYYAAKYAGKGVHNDVERDPEMLDEALEALKGRRLHTCFGTWRMPADFDDVYPDEWRTIGTLRSVLERSRSGDPAAVAILAVLTSGDLTCTEPRSPPVRGE